MKVQGNIKPISKFTVINYDGVADLIFRENITDISPDEAPETLYQWDEYHLKRKWTTAIYDEIMANYDPWINAAKLEDERRTPVDVYQLRADTDFLELTQGAMMGISVMSLASDPQTLEMARKYYPLRWSKDRLRMLVQIQKLMPEDYQSITGESYETEDAI